MGGRELRKAACSRRALLIGGLLAAGMEWRPRWLLGSGNAQAAVRRRPDVQSWVGEVMQYQVGCPILQDLARGDLRFQRIKDTSEFLALLRGRLQGVVGVIALQRVDLYASLMAWSEDHRRLVPVWYAEQVTRLGVWRRKVLIFHPGKSEYTEHKIYPHRTRKRQRKTQSPTLDDPLSAFYNWRSGVFGPLGPGERYQIDNLARKKPFVLRLQMASEEETARLLALEPEPQRKVHLVKAQIGEKLREYVRGDVHAWLDQDWVPTHGRATRVKYFGELTGRLVRHGRLAEPERPSAPPPPLDRKPWTI